MLNSCVLMGRIVHTPELKTTQSGTSVVSFTMAVERSYAPKGQQRETDFIDCVAWRNTEEFICRYFGKGQLIAVVGELQTRNFEDKQGNKRKAVEVNVSQVSFTGDRRNDIQKESSSKIAQNGLQILQDNRNISNQVSNEKSFLDAIEGEQTALNDLASDDDLPF